MAEQTTSSIVVNAPADRVMDVIADFPSYPTWAQGMKQVEVRVDGPDGRAREVHFELEAAPIKDSYTLGYEWDGNDAVHWHLVEGKMLKSMQGSYLLTPSGEGTEVTYKLTVEVAIPMIGLLRRKAEKVIIDSALKGLKKRVELLG